MSGKTRPCSSSYTTWLGFPRGWSSQRACRHQARQPEPWWAHLPSRPPSCLPARGKLGEEGGVNEIFLIKIRCCWFVIDLTYLLPWWLSGEESACQCRRLGFSPWVGKMPWRRKWQPTPVFLPGKSHGQRNLAGYNPWGRKEWDMT